MNSERFRTALFFGFLTLALGLCFALVFPFLRLIGWAVVLAVVAYPIHRRVARRIRQPSLAAAASCLLLVLIVVLPVTLLAMALVNEATVVVRDLQSAVEDGTLSRWERLPGMPAFGTARRWLEGYMDLSQLNLESAIRQAIGQISSFLAEQSMGLVRNAVWGLIQFALTMVTLFFMLRDSPRLLPAVRAFIPLNEAQTDVVLRRAADTIHATVYGASVVAAVQGTLGGLTFWALGLPSPLLWGSVMTVLCFVPLFGTPVVWVPASLLLAVQGLYWKALVLAALGAVVISPADNFLRPIVIGAHTQLHMLLVCLSVWGGLLLMGPLGLVMGPVIFAVTLALLDVVKLKLAEWDKGANVAFLETESAETA